MTALLHYNFFSYCGKGLNHIDLRSVRLAIDIKLPAGANISDRHDGGCAELFSFPAMVDHELHRLWFTAIGTTYLGSIKVSPSITVTDMKETIIKKLDETRITVSELLKVSKHLGIFI